MQFMSGLVERHTRSPKHNFAVEVAPWEIQPVLIAPVLPGETLNSLTLQSRVVTPPIKSRIVGWWLEYYMFYVPFRQMPAAASLVAMFVDPNTSLSNSAAAAYQYYDGNGFNFIAQCLQVIVQEWFRREGESWSAFTIRANRPAAAVNQDNWLESFILSSVLPDGGSVAGNVDDVSRAQMVLEYRRQLAIAGGDGGNADYEEILASYGASLKRAKERDRPELIRYIRDWTYPTNTVEPTTGTPTTAASWAITDRADKSRRFTEPGFIVGVQVVRPKVYLSTQTTPASSMLDRAQRWLPPVMDETGAERSLVEYSDALSPLADLTVGASYWVDLRDLFNLGDQYIDAVAANINAIPLAASNKFRYATQANADALQVAAGALTIADGNIQLNIKTRHVSPS